MEDISLSWLCLSRARVTALFTNRCPYSGSSSSCKHGKAGVMLQGLQLSVNVISELCKVTRHCCCHVFPPVV